MSTRDWHSYCMCVWLTHMNQIRLIRIEMQYLPLASGKVLWYSRICSFSRLPWNTKMDELRDFGGISGKASHLTLIAICTCGFFLLSRPINRLWYGGARKAWCNIFSIPCFIKWLMESRELLSPLLLSQKKMKKVNHFVLLLLCLVTMAQA